jgi:hypothetical protein
VKKNRLLPILLFVVVFATSIILVPEAWGQTASAATAANTVSIPKVTGPIPVTATSHPFAVGGTNLADYGYRLDEYFISGKANVYDWGADGKALIPQVRTPDAPYTTKITVRRPVDSAKFSGNVWVELNNPSQGWDNEVQWVYIQDKVLRDGDIWVAVTVKPNVIASLKRTDPIRYAPLSMANPLPPEKQTVGKLPGEEGYDENLSKLYENGLVWDIVSQTGALVRSKDKSNPLNDYNVKYVLATGESQTGFFLNTYAANFAENVRLDNGKTVYDGFVSASGAGMVTPLNQSLKATTIGDPHSLLPSKHVPFMRVDAQGDVFQLSGYLTRRSDSDEPGAGYRMYEIAGGVHGPSVMVNYQPLEADITKAGFMPYTYGGVEPKANKLPRHYFEMAMYRNMERWVIQGIAPPHAKPIKVQDGIGVQTSLFGQTIYASFVKDEYSNVIDGVRNPYVDVPTATYYEYATLKDGYYFAWSFGHQIDFTSQALQRIYGTVGAHQNYVAKVKESVKELASQRWIEPQEAAIIIKEAELTPIP